MRRKHQFSLRALLGAVGVISTAFSLIRVFPALAAMLMLLLSVILPAIVVLGVLFLLQLPGMLLAGKLRTAHRKRVREDRRAFAFPQRRAMPPASQSLASDLRQEAKA